MDMVDHKEMKRKLDLHVSSLGIISVYLELVGVHYSGFFMTTRQEGKRMAQFKVMYMQHITIVES